ncbi:MAG: diacylglycerol kinase family lipid kinase [Flavobacteriales bacterium]|nr:diacylglycerol kinase family lipid kinase [Flavobacteriales bacterium]
MTKRKILIIINPISGTGKHQSVVVAAQEMLKGDEFEYELAFTKARNHATELSAEAAKAGVDIVAAVGGDGTMHEVAKGLVGTTTAMAILPRGSGNGLARNMGIPMKLKNAIEVLKNAKTMKIDTVLINEDRFFGVAGIGFDALIAWKFAEFGKRGLQSYIKISLSEWAKYKPVEVELEIDGKKYFKTAFLMSFANSSQFGNNAVISPNASIVDGLIDVCVMKEFPSHQAPGIATRMFTNSIDKSRYLEVIQGKDIKVKQEFDFCHLDGEPVKLGNEMHIRVDPKSLNIVVPGIEYSMNKSYIEKFKEKLVSSINN